MRVAINAIVTNPSRYPFTDQGVRVYRLKKFPFRLYYTFDAEAEIICIYAVMHEKRRPDYWRTRLPGT